MPGVRFSALKLLLLLIVEHASVSTAFDVWFGTAPVCKGKPNHCHLYDLKYIRTDKSGSGSKCTSGNKVLCEQHPLEVSLKSTPANEMVVVSYNVMETPFATEHNGQTERTCHIPRALLNKVPDADVVVLNGLFIGGCMQSQLGDIPVTLTSMMHSYGFVHATPVLGETSRSIFNSNGGTMILSRWLIIETMEMTFNNYAGVDRFRQKGVLYARISKHGTIYNVFGTDMQFGDDEQNIRMEQAREVAMFIADVELPRSEPVIIAGDFNCDRNVNLEQIETLLKEMHAEMPPIIGDVRSTVDASKNEMVDPTQATKEWLDYIVYSSLHRKPGGATLEALELKANTGVKFCVAAPVQFYYVSPEAALCGGVRTTSDLSDHFPVIGRFVFNGVESDDEDEEEEE